jgi:hypothetical protein
MFTHLFASLSAVSMNTYMCSDARRYGLPTLWLLLGDRPFMIPPTVYYNNHVVGITPSAARSSKSRMEDDEPLEESVVHEFILGDVFLKQHTAIFDVADARIGIALDEQQIRPSPALAATVFFLVSALLLSALAAVWLHRRSPHLAAWWLQRRGGGGSGGNARFASLPTTAGDGGGGGARSGGASRVAHAGDAQLSIAGDDDASVAAVVAAGSVANSGHRDTARGSGSGGGGGGGGGGTNSVLMALAGEGGGSANSSRLPMTRAPHTSNTASAGLFGGGGGVRLGDKVRL